MFGLEDLILDGIILSFVLPLSLLLPSKFNAFADPSISGLHREILIVPATFDKIQELVE